MILLLAALSKAETKSIAADLAAALSPDATAVATFFFKVFRRVLILWLRTVWLAVFLMFLIADCVFAIVKNCGTHHHERVAKVVKRLMELALDFVSRIL